jgi:CRP-like cAMP-binding protein
MQLISMAATRQHGHADASGNRLLAALDPGDLALLAPALRPVSMRPGAVLHEPDASVEQVYFPLSGAISLLSVMHGGEVIETATVGREGAVGAVAGLGRGSAFSRAVVLLPGTAAAISVSRFKAAVSEGEGIRDLVFRHGEALLAQVQQTGACNALHPLEARFARLLLEITDRADDTQLPLTQESIAHLLAARRSTITVIASRLQASGSIRYHRGRIEIIDRPLLEHVACECYGTIRRRADAVFARDAAREDAATESRVTANEYRQSADALDRAKLPNID